MIWSAEWTWGAIGACEKLAYEYNLVSPFLFLFSLLSSFSSIILILTSRTDGKSRPGSKSHERCDQHD